MVSDSFIYPDKLSSLEREQGLDNLITLALETSLKIIKLGYTIGENCYNEF